MGATITDFINRVRNQIRDNGTITAFTDNELTQYINDSVFEYSRYKPRKRPYTLQLNVGKTEYQLPSDWVKVDDGSFKRAILPAPLPEPGVYALPFIYVNEPLGTQLNTMKFDWYDDDQLLILNSSPFQDYTITFNYYAYHTVDDIGTTVPMQYQYAALLPAYEKALRALASDYTVKLQKYRVGGMHGVEVDDSKIAENLLKEAGEYNTQFRKEVVLRPFGTSGGDDNGSWR